jgi:glutathione-regulated potassium-efflux system ancillary protein KefG
MRRFQSALTTMNRVLILFAHPAPHKSLVNRHLVAAAEEIEGITVRHLYEIYPDFLIDVRAEQKLLEQHDVIILQHPFYWYSSPAIVKEWLDLVLEPGWAYGEGGTALQGKRLLQAVTCGGGVDAYCSTGRNCHSVRDFLLPFEQSAALCGMTYLPPFVVHGAVALKTAADLEPHLRSYQKLLQLLREDALDMDKLADLSWINAGPYESLTRHGLP